MRSDNTFSEELGILSSLPGVLKFQEDDIDYPLAPFSENIRYNFDNSPVSFDIPGLFNEDTKITRIDLAPVASMISGDDDDNLPGVSIDRLIAELFNLNGELVVKEFLNDPSRQGQLIGATAIHGTDALGQYLPWHYYATSKRTPWGIYLSLANILDWAGSLVRTAASIGCHLSILSAIRLAFFATYRHELFHFHVERFATRQEILQQKPIYGPYDKRVFQAKAGTSDWYEEALAQAVVLESRFLRGRIGIPSELVKKILKIEFDSFGPGYKDYECSGVGGRDSAHKLLGAQIVTQDIKPVFQATSISIPKVEYGADYRIVPGYLVWQPSFVSRFQFATPETMRVKTWLKNSGFSYYGPGPGDHEVWQYNSTGEKVHLNSIGKECDIASLKAIAKILDKNVFNLSGLIRGKAFI